MNNFLKTLITLVVLWAVLKNNMGVKKSTSPFGGLGSLLGGGKSSNSVDIEVNFDDIQKDISNSKNITTTTVDVDVTAMNEAEVSNSSVFCTGNLITQIAEAKGTVILDLDQQNTTEMTKDIERAIKNNMTQNLTAKRESMGFGTGDVENDVNQTYNTNFNNTNIKNKLKELNTSMKVSPTASNKAKISKTFLDPCGMSILNGIASSPNSSEATKQFVATELVKLGMSNKCKCPTITQSAVAEAYAGAIVKEVMTDKTITRTKTEQETTSNTAASATGTGALGDAGRAVAGISDSVFGGIAGIFNSQAMMIAASALVVLVVVGGAIMVMKPDNKPKGALNRLQSFARQRPPFI